MKKLKVIQIIDSLNVGGAEVLAVNIANGLLEQNIESHLCVTRKEGDLKKNISKDVGYLFLEKKSSFDVRAIFKLKNYIKENNIQIIHAHSTSSFIAFCIKFISPKIKIIWHNHTGAYVKLKGKKKSVLKFIVKPFNYIISVNSNLVDWAKNELKHKKGSYVANFPNFTDLTNTTILKGEHTKRVVCLAGLRPVKDHLNLIKSFAIAVNTYPDWTLHLIGKQYNDAYIKSVIDLIKNEKLEKNVFFYGVCSDVKNILDQSTIGVLSSKSEGLPVSLLEYGLAKLPVLVTNVGECSLVVKDKESIVSPQRSDKFAEALKYLIENKVIREKIAINLQKNIVKNFSKESAIKQFIKIYTHC